VRDSQDRSVGFHPEEVLLGVLSIKVANAKNVPVALCEILNIHNATLYGK
jgi:hypothetical protein